METFHEMLKASTGWEKFVLVESYSKVLKLLIEAEVQLARQSTYKGNKLADLLLHKCELERDILKAQLEELAEKFNTPVPSEPVEEVKREGCCLRKKSPAQKN